VKKWSRPWGEKIHLARSASAPADDRVIEVKLDQHTKRIIEVMKNPVGEEGRSGTRRNIRGQVEEKHIAN